MWRIFFSVRAKAAQVFVVILVVAVVGGSSPLFVLAQVVDEQPVDTGPAIVDGTVGEGGEVGQSSETVPVFSENSLTDGGEGAESLTGGAATSSESDVVIDTGDASAGGLISTDLNSNDIESTIASSSDPTDLDDYTLSATGTNDGIVDNLGTTSAITGENIGLSDDGVFITTGDAVSVLNIANVLNTSVINSDGFMYLSNQVLDDLLVFDLSGAFFPGGMSSLEATGECNLMSCAAENVTYNLLDLNNATITNNANIDAVSGRNEGEGSFVSIATGESYGAANVINIANTNIIDSNYRLLTVNGIGTLNGDLVLPSEALFRAFFGLPNGMERVEDAEALSLNDANSNTATVNNNLNTNAETGANTATTTLEGIVQTGIGYAESNVVNEVNKNLFGGDSLYMLIRVHGAWNGNVFGLPEGLTWTQTPEGIVIYSTEAEIVPSEILQYDIDSYEANFNNVNNVVIDNNININSVSGENALAGEMGLTQTGNAYAGANVMNVANTNVVGRNWIMAIMNIFGDFNGNVSFGRPDLWIGGQVQGEVAPVGPNTKLVYTYTIKNNGDLKATNVEVRHRFNAAHIRYQGESNEPLLAEDRQEVIGTLLPGEERIVSFDAFVDDMGAYGTSTVSVVASLTMRESDNNLTDNTETLALTAVHSPPVISSGGGSNGGGGGGGGGGKKSGSSKSAKSKANVKATEIAKKKVDPDTPPLITIKKKANVVDNKVVRAGEEVEYTVTVNNSGGTAYNAEVFDRLINPIGATVSEQSWELGTIKAGEKITLEYTIKYEDDTPSGTYTNTASIVAYRKPDSKKRPLIIPGAVHTLEIDGQALSIGNVGVATFIPNGNGRSAAIVAWETILPTDGQVFFDTKGVAPRYDPSALNYGYTYSSFHYPVMTTRHYIVLLGLHNGETYDYRLRSRAGTNEVLSREYSFTVPEAVPLAVTKATGSPGIVSR